MKKNKTPSYGDLCLYPSLRPTQTILGREWSDCGHVQKHAFKLEILSHYGSILDIGVSVEVFMLDRRENYGKWGFHVSTGSSIRPIYLREKELFNNPEEAAQAAFDAFKEYGLRYLNELDDACASLRSAIDLASTNHIA